MLKRAKSLSLLSTSLLMTTALTAFADGHGAKTLGQTTALIAEAGLATTPLKDGESGNVNLQRIRRKSHSTLL